MYYNIIYSILFPLLLLSNQFYFINNNIKNTDSFKLGNEVLLDEKLDLLVNKRVALITNRTGIVSNGSHILKELGNKNINVVKIFTPEHGFSTDDSYDNQLINIPIISLYGNEKSIQNKDLIDVDVLIYDIQDLGARYYTYTSTLYLTMKDAKENGKMYIICDRPSVANLNYVSGFVLNKSFSSFVGLIPVPVMYGMTVGELGNMLNDELTGNSGDMNLVVVPMKNYTRETLFENLNLNWVNPSPSIISLESAVLYPATCFLEGTNISEGRGTDTPFQLFGAPFCNSDELISLLNSYEFKGVDFTKTEFIPSQKISSYTPKFLNDKCYGVKITISNFKEFQPVEISVAILIALKESCKEFKWTEKNYIDKLAGTDKLRKMINDGENYSRLINEWKDDVEKFKIIRNSYLLYK